MTSIPPEVFYIKTDLCTLSVRSAQPQLRRQCGAIHVHFALQCPILHQNIFQLLFTILQLAFHPVCFQLSVVTHVAQHARFAMERVLGLCAHCRHIGARLLL
jgi:hypothetical protein